ncbi:FtsX-like permease family protein [Bariatricus sp. HCP28S3_C2]|uniref:ABC transporter permease n=1 Tax=unclassified Bariatricus TaxID=2677046 RepID=UPI003F891AE5
MLILAYKYMRYYKSQTFAILASIILTAALLSGVSSLIYSSQMNSLETHKAIYGDWHYYLDVEPEVFEEVRSGQTDAGFQVEQCGKMEIRDVVTEPYLIYFINTDESYRQMAHRELIEGIYPAGSNEIAADRYTLGNLGFSGEIGDTLSLNGKDYVMTGIIKSAWAASSNEMELFVGEDFEGRGSQPLLYLRFDESEKLYKQLDVFLKKYQISSDAVTANDEVVRYLGGEQPDSIADIVKFALTDESGNFTYIVLKLQSEYNLAFNGMILLLCVFSLFIINSIFHISVSKRTAEYGVMQTLGISEKSIGGTLILELWILFFIGYPMGCLLGNGILNQLYGQLDGVFSTQTVGVAGTGIELSGLDQTAIQESMRTAAFHVSWDAMVIGFLFLLVTLAAVGFCTVYSVRKQSIRQVMSGDTSFVKSRRKIYSLRNVRLANVVVRKFMFSNKKRVIGILLSLSIGGCIFLCTTYMVENLKVHAEMSMKSDDGLGSEYRVSVKSNVLSDTIPASTVDAIKAMSELSEVYATKYTLGELTIQAQELEWEKYFNERNADGYFQQQYGGICIDKEDGTYGIKYDVYGYDAGLLEQLQEFILEGEMIPEKLEEGNQIIAVANMDGQGNYNFYGKHPGDTITLRVPGNLNCSQEVLTFREAEENYIAKDFKIAAIVSRALVQEDRFLNVEPWSNSPSFIMTNRQMSSQFGIEDYSFVNASPAAGADPDQASGQLLQKIQDVPKAVLQDYTAAIETQKNYLRQQQLFFSGIALILLVISLFHIMNSMNYSILFHRREYGIIRAMGITDIGFYGMILRTGFLYGILADLFIFLIYNIVFRKIMDYYMAHVVQFLHFTAGVPNGIMAALMVLNILIAIIAVSIPARKIVKSNIIDEIER